MPSDFVKLYKGFWTGSMRDESPFTKLVFIAMLSLSDEYGMVEAGPRFISDFSTVTLENVTEALRILESPDPDSTSQVEDGRRIIKIKNNRYQIVNYRDYYEMHSVEQKRSQAAERQRKHRERAKVEPERHAVSRGVTKCNTPSFEIEIENKNNPPIAPQGAAEAWEQFRATYPKRDGSPGTTNGKKKFMALLSKGVDATTMIEGAARYAAWAKESGKEGTVFVKQIPTWLNQECWTEDVGKKAEERPRLTNERGVYFIDEEGIEVYVKRFKNGKPA